MDLRNMLNEGPPQSPRHPPQPPPPPPPPPPQLHHHHQQQQHQHQHQHQQHQQHQNQHQHQQHQHQQQLHHHHQQNHRPTPPPLQPPRSPFQSPVHGGPGPGYPQQQQQQHPQSQSPYHPSPPPNRHFQFPPPPSPHQHQHQGYAQSPSTPHPPSAHTIYSTTPTSSISNSPHNHFPQPQGQGQGIQYANHQQQQQHHLLHPPPSPHQYHSQHQQQQQIQQQQQGYTRQSPIQQSPIHSPIGGRPQLIHQGSSGINDRSIPTISAPIARRDQEREREREREQREREREREQREREERERQRERERERERAQRERERDISVSPKTRVPVYLPDEPITDASKEEDFTYPGPQQNSRPNSQHGGGHQGGYTTRPRSGSSVIATPNHDRRNIDAMDVDGRETAPGAPAVPDQKWPVTDRGKPNGSAGIGNGRDGPSQQLAPQQQQHPSPSQQNTQQPPPPPPPPLTTPTNSNSSSTSSSQRTATVSPSLKDQPHQPPPIIRSTPTPTNPNSRAHPPPPPSPKPNQQLGPPPTPTTSHAVEGNTNSSPGSGGPPRKRPRRDEAPIWARKASRSSSSSPVMANRRQPSSSSNGPPPPQSAPPQQNQQPAPPSTQQQQQQQAQHPPQQHPQPRLSAPAGPQRNVPLFGPWEPSIANSEPHEELTRAIADFLWREVIQKYEAQPVGEVSAMIEIEAKIGHLIDKNTNSRLQLPVCTETVIDERDRTWGINFRSSMTEHQHKHLNRFLNRLYDEAKAPPVTSATPPPGPTRISMEYIHTRERDSFYELPPSQISTLPQMLRDHLNPRHKVKVRVTTEQRSGKVLNKIIKARIADCNIYSPMTRFDWRVSVNMEMPWTGDLETLTPMSEGGEGGVRMKDRLSYRHLAYQIDLTQVTDGTKSTKEHELEVEVSGKEIRKHGQLANQQKPNAYEALVRGFVDNVRVLVRGAAPAEAMAGCGCTIGGPGRG